MKNTGSIFGIVALAAAIALTVTACGNGNNDTGGTVSPTMYTVTYNSDGGSATASAQVENGKYAAVPTQPTKAHYDFDGWYAPGATTAFAFASTPITADITLTAKWIPASGGYTITFDSNGGSAVAPITGVGHGTIISAPTPPTRGADTFVGWFPPVGTVAYNFGSTVESSFTLQARWSSTEVFSVIFDSNGGSLVNTVTNLSSGATVAKPADPTMPGHNFVGWTESGYVTPFDFSTPITGNIVLTAQWEVILGLMVTFDSNGGSPVDAIENMSDGMSVVEPEAPTRASWHFEGWFLVGANDVPSATPFNFETERMTRSITLRAGWNENPVYRVTFLSNGGSPVDGVPRITSGLPVAQPANPTRAGWNFVNWYTLDDDLTPYVFTTPITANLVLQARWTGDLLNVTFNSDGGSAVDNVTGIITGTVVSEPAAPTRLGHRFEGWFLGAATEPFNFSSPITASITLTARWETLPTLSITFVSNGGSEVNAYTGILNGDTRDAPNPPMRGGWNFTGWFTQATDGAPHNWATPITSNLTLHAQWSQVLTFTVTFNSAGGTAVAPQTGIANNGRATQPTNPTRARELSVGLWRGTPAQNRVWVFDGWRIAGQGANFNFANTPITANITLVAQWSLPAGTAAGTQVGGIAGNSLPPAVAHINANPGTYTLVVDQNSVSTQQSITAANAHLHIISAGQQRDITLQGSGHLLNLNGANRSLTLENITLIGTRSNNRGLVNIAGGASMTMNDLSTIQGNTISTFTAGYTTQGAAVSVVGVGSSLTLNSRAIIQDNSNNLAGPSAVYINNGSLVMNTVTSEIHSNTGSISVMRNGGAVLLAGADSRFTMNNGYIRANGDAASGGNGSAGAVNVLGGVFTMAAGSIYDNQGMWGAVAIDGADSVFTMTGGSIHGNIGAAIGGAAGVSVTGGGTFVMNGSGATIERNSVSSMPSSAGGVSVSGAGSNFNFISGTIYGANGGGQANIATGNNSFRALRISDGAAARRGNLVGGVFTPISNLANSQDTLSFRDGQQP